MTINEVNITPKKIPFKCPVCNGFGSLQYGKKVCHACNGKGYVVIDNEEGETDDKKYTTNR
jgi:DnaJ-class molecular chaperone